MTLDFSTILEMFPGPAPPATEFNAVEMNKRWQNLDDRINALELNNVQSFFVPGGLVVGDLYRFVWPFQAQNISIGLAVTVKPTDADILAQLEVGGVDVFKAAERPKITGGSFFGAFSVVGTDLGSVNAGDNCIFQIDQVGSTIAGSNISAIIRAEKSLA